MTELLRHVIAEIEKLSEEEQDAIATRLLAELKDDRAWKVRFESTTNEQWDRLAEMVRLEITAGNTTPLNDVFPPKQADGIGIKYLIFCELLPSITA